MLSTNFTDLGYSESSFFGFLFHKYFNDHGYIFCSEYFFYFLFVKIILMLKITELINVFLQVDPRE